MSRGRIVVVDGDEWTGRLLMRALEAEDFVVELFAEAQAAFQRVCEVAPDCIVSATELPDIDGFWLARRIRTEAAVVAKTPILFIGEENDKDARSQALSVGGDVFIRRPVTNDEASAARNTTAQVSSAGSPPSVKAPPFWAMYVGVPNLEETVAKITRLGGRTHTEVITVPDIGRMQLIMDPQGAAFYIIEPASSERRPEGAPEVGDASWHELMTTDMPAAMKFYEEVFGWQPTESMDMGPMGKYQMFNRPHGMIGGMMNRPPEMANVPPNWLIYFRVPDVDAAAARIKASGGRILNGPNEVPGGDRVLSATDPQGAAFGLHSNSKAE